MSTNLDQATAVLLQHEKEMERALSDQVPRSGSGMRVRGEYPIFIVSAAPVEDEAAEAAAPAVCIPVASASLAITGAPDHLELGASFEVSGVYLGTVGDATEPVSVVWELWDEVGTVIGSSDTSTIGAGAYTATFTAPAYEVLPMGIVGVFTNACGETTSSTSISVYT